MCVALLAAWVVAVASAEPGGAPSSTAAPSVSGQARVGQLLTASDGTWDGAAPMSYSYQWRRCDHQGDDCHDITGATEAAYRLRAADLDATVRVVVTASNTAGVADAQSAVTSQISPGGAYPAAVLDTSGLAHYWRLGESTGSTLSDSVGHADATATSVALGASGALTGESDTAASFDGLASVASAPVDLSGTHTVTVEFWLKWPVFANDDKLAMEFTSNFNSHDGGFLVDPNAPEGGGRFAVSLGSGSSRNGVMFDRPVAGEWHHYAFVLDTAAAAADQIVPYVDGQAIGFDKVASGTGAGNFADAVLHFMSRDSTSLLGSGDLDELAIYTDALSAATIGAHYHAGAGDRAPTARFSTSPRTPAAGETATFDASASADPDGSIARYEWDFDGDGDYDATRTTPVITHTYSAAQTPTVRLRVTDDHEVTDVVAHAVHVAAQPGPYARAVLDTSGLTHYWRLDEAAGSTLWDSVGTSDASAANVALGSSGALVGDSDTATAFDGVASVASAPIDLSGTDKLTLEFWLKWSAYADDDRLAMELTPNFNDHPGGFLVDPNAPQSGGAFAVSIGSGPARNGVTFPRPSAAAWHHYAFVVDADAPATDQITPYVDGQPVAHDQIAAGTGAGNFANSVLHFMSRNSAALLGAGGLDDLAIYSTKLSAQTINAHYRAAIGNRPPMADLAATPRVPAAGQAVTLDASESTDSDGEIATYEWDLDGDGTYGTTTHTPTVTHTYPSARTVIVGLRITDDEGATDTATRTVHVTPRPGRYARAVLDTTGLAHYWRLGEVTGTTLWDSFGSSDATASNVSLSTPGALTGDGDTGARFDGSTSTASAPVDLSGTDRATVEFWLKWSSYADDDRLAMEFTSNFNDHPGGFLVDPNAPQGGGKFAASMGIGSSRNGVMFSRPTAGDWHHYAFVLDAAALADEQITPYVDGEPVSHVQLASGTGAGSFANSTLYFMSRNTTSLLGGGDLDDLAIYTSKLTAEAIHEHYVKGTTPALGNSVLPSVTGTVEDGETLTATSGAWDGAESIDFAYQWLRCDVDGDNCAAVLAGTDQTYALSADDVGSTLRVRVSASSSVGDGIATSAPTDIIRAAPPRVASRPAITGTPVATATLAADHGAWSGTQPVAFSYQWVRCDASGDGCVELLGETADRYVLGSADLGATLRVKVTATNGAGTQDATSDATDSVASAQPPARIELPAIAGTTTVGSTLTSTYGDWSGTAPFTFGWQWKRCDTEGVSCTDIAGAIAATYQLTAADAGHAVRVSVHVANAVGAADATSDVTDSIVMAPASISPATISGNAVDGRRLSASRGGWDGTRPLAASYQWRRCDAQGGQCSDIVGATNATYDLTHDDVGAALRVVVSVSNSAGAGASTSMPTSPIAASAPSNVVPPRVGGIAQPGGQFHARIGRWDGTPEVVYAYTWLTCDADGASCQPITGATAEALDIDADMAGGTVRLAVEASNAVGTTTATSAPSKVVGAFGATVDGLARVGEMLTAVPGELLSTAPEFTYQWQRCSSGGTECNDLDGETHDRLRLTNADLGATMRVVVGATHGTDVTVADSPVTAPVSARVPVNRELPVVAGRAIVGSTISATTGEWDPAGGVTYSWSRCAASGATCDLIAGANAKDYVVQSDDVGWHLRIAVTETTNGGSAAAVSRLGPAVEQPALVNTVVPTLAVQPGSTGDVLIADVGHWDGQTPVAYAYEWQSCDATGEGCDRIHGASEATYPLRHSDIGRTVRVVVEAENALGREMARSSATAPIATNPVTVATPATVAGSTKSGELLSVAGATWRGVGPLTLAHQWRRCDLTGDDCHDIPMAAAPDYVARDDDVGHTLRVATTATGAAGTASTVTVPTALVTAADAPPEGPTPTTAPTITGTVAQGELLTANPGTWAAIGPITFSYQWRLCDAAGGECEDIAGQTGSTFSSTSSQVGHAVAVRIVANDGTSSAAALATTATSVRASDGPTNETRPIVSGSIREGEQLSATNGTWSSLDALTYDVRWQACDDGGTCTDIDEATGITHDVTDEDVGARLRAVVTARDGHERWTSVVSDQTSVVAPATPRNTQPPAISGTPETGVSLQATTGTWDGVAPLTFAYQWQSCDAAGDNCANVESATAADYPLGGGDVGTTLRVVVSATNGFGTVSEISDTSARVSDAGGPAPSSPPSIVGTPRENSTIGVDHGTWTASGPVTYSYRWFRCDSDGSGCAVIIGATDSALAVTGDLVFSVLRVEVTARDDVGSRTLMTPPSDQVESAATDVNPAIVNTSRPLISDEWRVGLVLTSSTGGWDGASGLTYRYRWWSCDGDAAHCALIADATNASFTPGIAELGRRVRVMVTAASGAVSVTIMSAPTGAIGPPRPTATLAPTVSGSTVDGSLLTSDHGTWIPAGVGFNERWQRCDEHGEACADIPSATGLSYWLTAQDIGHTLRSVIQGTNADGVGTAVSAPTAAIAPLAPSSSGAPSISGLARQEGTLSAAPGWFDGSPELTYDYTWLRCDTDGESCEAIVGADGGSYTLVAADLGARVRVQVTATNAAGQATGTSDATDVVDAAAAPVLASDGAPVIRGDAHDGQQLHADPGQWVAASPVTYSYQWESCDQEGSSCTAIVGATEPAYQAGTDDVGSALRVSVTAHNASGVATATSAPTAAIETSAPMLAEPPYVEGDLRPGLPVVVHPGDWRGSGPISYSYQWRRCDAGGQGCADIPGATSSQYSLLEDDARQTIAVAVTATNDHGTHTVETDPQLAGGLRPENLALPVVTGTTHTDQSLTASPGEWRNEPDQFVYQWQVCDGSGERCEDLSYGYGSSLYLHESLAGHTVRVVVAAQNYGDEAPPRATSAVSALIGTASATNLTPPILDSDTPSMDFPIVVSPGQWLGDSITFTYQWLRCRSGSCSNIPGATQATYLPQGRDVGYALVAWVTGRTPNGRSATLATRPSDPVGLARPRNLEAPQVGGDAIVGATMSTSFGSWTASASDFNVSWQRCDASGAACITIPDSDSAEGYYTPRRADTGHTLRSAVVATGEGGNTTAVSEPSELVVAATRPAFVTVPTIQGTAAVGEWIDGGVPELSGSPEIDRAGQWERCDPSGDGCEPIPGATGWGYEVQRADAGFALRLRASITNGWGTVTRRTAPSATVPTAPPIVNVSAPQIQDEWWLPRHVVGNTIWADPGTWRGNPTLEGQWQRCNPHTVDQQTDAAECVDIEGATDVSYYMPVLADVGQSLRLTVTATGPGASPLVAYSDLTTPVGVAAWVSASFDGPVAVDEPVTVAAQVDGNHKLPTTYNYLWETSEFDDRTGQTWVRTVQDGADRTYTPTDEDRGRVLHVTVTVTTWTPDRSMVAGTTTTTLSNAVVAPLSNTVAPSVTGNTDAGQTLIVDPGTWQGGNGPVSFDYDWKRCDMDGSDCIAIVGADEERYETTVDDIGHLLVATVGAHIDSSYGDEEASRDGPRHRVAASAVGPIVAADRPTPTEAPSISGTASERAVLQAHVGTWVGSEPIGYAYQWQTCGTTGDRCQDIPDATSATYRVRTSDFAARLRVTVKATNAMGSADATSVSTDPVDAGEKPDPTAVPNLTLMGPSAPGSTLVTDGGTWTGARHSELTYIWQRCDAAGNACETIDGAVGDHYDLTDDDLEHRLQVVATANTDAGTASAISDTSALVGGGGPNAPSAVGKVAYVDAERTSLQIASPDGTSAATLVRCSQLQAVGADCRVYSPRISPNLRMVAFEARAEADGPGTGRIYLVNIDGTGLRYLTTGSDPAWTPDGLDIVFTESSPDSTRAMIIAADGVHDDARPAVFGRSDEDEANGPAQMGALAAPAAQLATASPDVSDDGSIVFVGRRGTDKPDLYVAEDTSDPTPRRIDLHDRFPSVSHPRFTPDGGAIVFSVLLEARQQGSGFAPGAGFSGGDGYSLWEVNTSGSGLHRVSPDDGRLYSPAAPTDDEVFTTRSDFEWCSHPTFAPAATSLRDDDICEVSDGRGYAINHDGSNPHFLGLRGALDIDAPVRRKSGATALAERIYIEQGLDQLERYANSASAQAGKSALGKSILASVTRGMARGATKVTIIGTVLDFLRDTGNLSCDTAGFDRQAHLKFVASGALLEQIAGASIAAHPVLASRAATAQTAMQELHDYADRTHKHTNKKCKIHYRIARDVAARTAVALEHGATYLQEIDYQHQRRAAHEAAQEPRKHGTPIGSNACTQAPELVDALGRGSGRRNHVVYWAPPPPLDRDVRYIGRSRALDTRCAKHDLDIRSTLATLRLPPLTLDEARDVEEALIAHFGTQLERPTHTHLDRLPGQLTNQRHEIDPLRPDYCDRLLIGQFILVVHDYAAYASAFYTRGTECPGVGGPR